MIESHTIKRNETISIVKALGIILMVVGHSGCPKALSDYIYMFHMPLFFFCSGYFLKETDTIDKFQSFTKKKIKGLYIPYILWEVTFLLLHNFFYEINIYNGAYGFNGVISHEYKLDDFIHKFVYIIFMNEGEQLLGGFWFLKSLFFSSIFSGLFYLLNSHLKINDSMFMALLLIFTYVTKSYDISLPILGSISHILLCIIIMQVGKNWKKTENKDQYKLPMFIIMSIIVIIGSKYNVANILSCNITDIIPYLFFSTIGIISMFSLSYYLKKIRLKKILIYIGDNTMIILALHFLSFKIVNLIKIGIYNMQIEKLACFPVIKENNDITWILYSIIGILLPLSIKYLYKKISTK